MAGPEIDAIVDRVLAYPEFKDLSTLPGRVIWYQRRKFIDERPVFAFVKKWDDDAVWDAEHVRHIEGYQRWKLGLNWRNFDELATEGNFVTDETLERHIFLALMGVIVTEGKGITKNPPSIETWHEAVSRYGAYDGEMVRLQGLLALAEPEA